MIRRFKVGDYVKVISTEHHFLKKYIGKVGRIDEIFYDDTEHYKVKFVRNGITWYFYDKEVEKVSNDELVLILIGER